MSDESKPKDGSSEAAGAPQGRHMTQLERLERSIRNEWKVGEIFTLEDVYEEMVDELERDYPDNKNVHATIRDLIQQLRDEGEVQFFGERGSPEAGVYKRIA